MGLCLNHGKLYNTKIHEYHKIKPRIVFETPEFPYADRLKAIELAKDVSILIQMIKIYFLI